MDTTLPVVLHTQATPNPAAYKFMLSEVVLPQGAAEFTKDNRPAEGPAFLNTLLSHPGIERLYLSSSFITVVKNDTEEWFELALWIRQLIGGNDGWTAIKQPGWITQNMLKDAITEESGYLHDWFRDNVLPATAKDGGAIFLKSEEDGNLNLALAGACKGCPYIKETVEKGIVPPLKNLLPNLKQILVGDVQ